MKLTDIIDISLLALVLLNQRRLAFPSVKQDLAALVNWARAPDTTKARDAFWRIVLTAALPGYIASIIAAKISAML